MMFQWQVRRAWVLPFVLVSTLITLVAAGAAAAIETDTVESTWAGVWWAISLVTTVGFVGAPPTTFAGQALSILLMVLGFLLLAMVSAALASLFVRDAEAPRDAEEE
ncbi:MAG: ion channel, partial [Vicinamibacterales bacterium]